MEVEGRPDVVLDLSSPGMFEYQWSLFMSSVVLRTEHLEKVKKSPIIIKEGVDYRMKVKFRYASLCYLIEVA
jgi:Rho GDP-dissociation inhibitor